MKVAYFDVYTNLRLPVSRDLMSHLFQDRGFQENLERLVIQPLLE